MEIKITHFNMQLSCSSFLASRFQQTAKHLKRCSPSLKNLHLEEKTGVRQISKGVLVITVGPCYFKQLALGIQEKQASSLIIVVTTWKQKKNCINRKFPSVCRVYRIFWTKKKKKRNTSTGSPNLWLLELIWHLGFYLFWYLHTELKTNIPVIRAPQRLKTGSIQKNILFVIVS